MLKGRHYKIELLPGEQKLDPIDDNVDIRVHFEDRTYAGTFFTVENIQRLFEKNEHSGECAHGLYFWATDMVLVRRLTRDTIARTIAAMISSGEFEKAFSRVA
jgi:hypothetical protein